MNFFGELSSALTLIGGLVTLLVGCFEIYRTNSKKKIKPTASIILMIIGGITTIVGGYLNQLESQDFNDKIEKFQLKMIENNRIRDSLTRSNITLTEKLFSQSDSLLILSSKSISLTENFADISKKSLDQITGGSSWAYVRPGTLMLEGVMNNQFGITLEHVGKNPLNNVNIEIKKIIYDDGVIGNPHSFKNELSKEIGVLAPNLYTEFLGVISLTSKTRHDYLVKIKASNGVILQHCIFIKKNETLWHYATRVFKWDLVDEYGAFSKRVIHEHQTKGFPLEKINWYEIYY